MVLLLGQLECFADGILTDSSLLVNGATAEDMAIRAKDYGLPLGLHINLTEGLPLCADAPSLCAENESGCMRGKHGFREALSRGDINEDDIDREIAAQWDRFRRVVGHPPLRWDGHQHVHVEPVVVDAIQRFYDSLADEDKPHVVRRPVLLPAERAALGAFPESTQAFYTSVSDKAMDATLPGHSPDCFVGFTCGGERCTVERVQHLLSTVAAPGSTLWVEWMTHPGRPDTDGGCGCGLDEFSQDPGRTQEADVLCDKNRWVDWLRDRRWTL